MEVGPESVRVISNNDIESRSMNNILELVRLVTASLLAIIGGAIAMFVFVGSGTNTWAGFVGLFIALCGIGLWAWKE